MKTDKFICSALVVLFSGFSLTAHAVVVGQFKGSLPPVDINNCNTPGYYSTYKAETYEAINASSDERLNEISADNWAHPTASIDEAIVNLAGLLQAQVQACDDYFVTCSTNSVSSERFTENVSLCMQEARNSFNFAKNATRTAVLMNANRKAEMTFTEKVKAIGHRHKTILSVILGDLTNELETLSSKASILIKKTRDVPGSKLQDA